MSLVILLELFFCSSQQLTVFLRKPWFSGFPIVQPIKKRRFVVTWRARHSRLYKRTPTSRDEEKGRKGGAFWQAEGGCVPEYPSPLICSSRYVRQRISHLVLNHFFSSGVCDGPKAATDIAALPTVSEWWVYVSENRIVFLLFDWKAKKNWFLLKN